MNARSRQPDDNVVGLREAAASLGVHYMTAYRYVRTGQLPAPHARPGQETALARRRRSALVHRQIQLPRTERSRRPRTRVCRPPLKLAIVACLVVAALLAQRWYGWDEGHALGGTDAESYEQIARAAPGLPAGQLPFHHAQRLAGPYLVGLAARAGGLEVRPVMAAATGGCLLLAILALAAAVVSIGVSIREFAICLALFALHFSLRFYLVAPGMLPDALFICGLALVLHGLTGRSLAVVLAGTLLAAAGRQTALLMLPGIALWIGCGQGWAQRSRLWKCAAIGAAIASAAGPYLASAGIASRFALPSENIVHLTGVFEWMRRGRSHCAARLRSPLC